MKSTNSKSHVAASSKSARRGGSNGPMFEGLESRTMRSVSPMAPDQAEVVPTGPATIMPLFVKNSVSLVGNFTITPIRVGFPIIWHQDAIQAKYGSLGGASGLLGTAETGEISSVSGGTFQAFQNGVIYYSPATGAHELHGPILQKFLAVGGLSKLGYPTSDVTNTALNLGQAVGFSKGGAIYHQNGASRAFALSGPTYQTWLRNGGVLGEVRNILGLPTELSQGFPTSDSIQFANGQVTYFQNVKMLNINGNVQATPISSTLSYNSGYLTTSDPVGGKAQLTVHSNGSYALSYQFNNSSLFSLPYKYTVSISMISPTGNVYAFSHTYTITGQDNGTITGVDAGIAANWKDLQGSRFVAQATASFSWSGLLSSLAKDLGQAVSWLSKAASEGGGDSSSGDDGSDDPGSDTGSDTGDWGDDDLG